MRIGLTYDLRSDYLKEGFSEEETAEFDKESTVEAIERELHFLGHSTERIGHILNLTKSLVEGKRWDLVFNISEGLYGIGREAQGMADSMLLLSSSKAEIADRVPAYQAHAGCEFLLDGAALTLPRQVKWVEVVAVNRMSYGSNTLFAQRASAFADGQAQGLDEPWAALTRHLHAGAAALLDLDHAAPPTRDPGLRALRLLARINFMERFRSTLWFCQVVWAHMASEKILRIQQM